MNPLIPTFTDGLVMAALVAGFALAIFAFVSLIRTRGLSALQVLLWSFAILVVPFLGPGAWFLVEARDSESRSRRRGAVQD